MARVNVDDDWWWDHRRSKLAFKVGDQMRADGLALNAWRLSQEFWAQGRHLVPKTRFFQLDMAQALIDCGLAEDRGDFIYVRGTEIRHEWRIRRNEAAQKGGLSKSRNHSGKIVANPSKSVANASKRYPLPLNTGPVVLRPTVPGENLEPNAPRGVAPTPDECPFILQPDQLDSRSKAKRFASAYVKAYQVRFPGMRPEDLNDGKVRGQILNWIKDYPMERACQLIQVYFQMETKWFGTKGYDFITFKNNLNKIGQALDSGVDLDGSRVDWAAVFQRGAS